MSVRIIFAMMLAQAVPGSNIGATAPKPPGDRMVPLLERKGSPGQFCTADTRWCVSLDARGGDEQVLPIVQAGDAARSMPQAPSEDTSNETHTVWPNLIILQDGGFLAGVETQMSTGYSGGGGSASDLHLFRIATDGQAAAQPVLSVPVSGSLMIRACFGEMDMKRRLGACHDEYSFSGKLSLSHGTTAGLPILAYGTDAQAFPRGVSRLEDSTQKPRLKKSDLVQERDPECSYARTFRFNSAAGIYEPNSPLPDCSAYTIP
ncbi:hypothetical protein IAG41_22580 [Sphingomonas sp. JC676]|uniref:hypothetical protein n=1 Tax=Sphingomonas sp. JC676 TaxID=2768065 RepID=UPI00165854CB|nr:hypothetical protein [Sphingomonas sp. JC676]MBC9035186.1 hypothetical protein [Sphingomonas sp. JC676]